MKTAEILSVVLEGDRTNIWENGDEVELKGYYFINWIADKNFLRPDFNIYFKALNAGNHISLGRQIKFQGGGLNPSSSFQRTQFPDIDKNQFKNMI